MEGPSGDDGLVNLCTCFILRLARCSRIAESKDGQVEILSLYHFSVNFFVDRMKIMLAVAMDRHKAQINKSLCEVLKVLSHVLHFKASGQKHCIVLTYKFGTKAKH